MRYIFLFILVRDASQSQPPSTCPVFCLCDKITFPRIAKCSPKETDELGHLPSSVQDLTLERSEIKDINTFGRWTERYRNLTSVVIADSTIGYVHSRPIRYLDNVKNYTLRNLPYKIFKNFPKNVEVLTITFTKIEEINGEAFNYFKSLKRLDISHNQINRGNKHTRTNKYSKMAMNLTEIDASYNQYPQFPFFLATCPSLETFKLSHNRITRMSMSLENAALKHLYLDHNSIQNIDNDFWKDLPSLESLDLTGNYIVSVNKLPNIPSLLNLKADLDCQNCTELAGFQQFKNYKIPACVENMDMCTTTPAPLVTISTFTKTIENSPETESVVNIENLLILTKPSTTPVPQNFPDNPNGACFVDNENTFYNSTTIQLNPPVFVATCLDQCKWRNYKYAALRNIQCLCSNALKNPVPAPEEECSRSCYFYGISKPLRSSCGGWVSKTFGVARNVQSWSINFDFRLFELRLLNFIQLLRPTFDFDFRLF